MSAETHSQGPDGTNGPDGTDGAAPASPEAIEADIAQQREQLAETIDALTAKLDVKSQAKAKVADVRDRATTDAGKPRPEVLVGAGVLVAVVVGVIVWRRRR